MSQDSKVWMLFNTVTQKRSEALTKAEMQMALFSMKIKEIENIFIWTVGWNNWQPLREFLSSDQRHFIGHNPNKKIKSIDENSVPEFSITNNEITQKVNLNKFKDQKELEIHFESETKTDVPLMKDITVTREVNHNPKSEKKKKDNAYLDKTFTKLVDNEEFLKNPKTKDFYRTDIDATDLDEDKVSNSKIFEINKKISKDFVPRSERHAFKIEVIVFFPNGKSIKSYSSNISLTGTLIEDNIPFEQNGKLLEIVIVNRFETDNKKARMTMKGKAVGEGVTRRLQFEELNEAQLNKLHELLAAYIEKEKELKAA